MPTSRIDCIHIKKPNCLFYDENRLCPDNCVGFNNGETIVSETVSIQMDMSIEEDTPIVNKRNRG